MPSLDVTLVIDRPDAAAELCAGLRRQGCRVETVVRDRIPPANLAASPSSLVVVNIEPRAAGALAWCRDVRAARPDSRICALFEEADETAQVVALETGADTVLVRPFSERLLLAHLHALARGRPRRPGRHDSGALVVDEGARSAKLAGRALDLTDTEFDLLQLLAGRPGQVVDRETIKREIRGLPFDSRDRSIDLCVVRLRRKLGDDAQSPRYIKSVRGQGYLLIAPTS